MKRAERIALFLIVILFIILFAIPLLGIMLFYGGVYSPSANTESPAYTVRVATGFGELGLPHDWQYSATTLTIVLKNQVGQAITVTNVSTASCSFNGLIPISSGGVATVTLEGCATKSVGERFSETVTVIYSVAGGLPRTATGTIKGAAAV